MPTADQAKAVAQAIVHAIPSSFAPLLSHIWLAGSLGRGVDFGGDIDLVLAVERQAFQKYLGLCTQVYKTGIDAIASNPAESLVLVTESEVKLERSWAALLTIGVPLRSLHLSDYLLRYLDIICLPSGFADPLSADRQYLLKKIRGFDDWLNRNPIEDCITLFPSSDQSQPKP